MKRTELEKSVKAFVLTHTDTVYCNITWIKCLWTSLSKLICCIIWKLIYQLDKGFEGCETQCSSFTDSGAQGYADTQWSTGLCRHTVEHRSMQTHSFSSFRDSGAAAMHYMTFSHLADAFIQIYMCDLQCIHILHLWHTAHQEQLGVQCLAQGRFNRESN